LLHRQEGLIVTATAKSQPADCALLSLSSVLQAQERIAPYINRTPLLESGLLNQWLGHEIVFKAESFQKIGAFKIRGALNALLSLKEEGRLPEKIVAYSSGNHAQAAAYAGKMLGIHTTVIMPENVSKIKQQATRAYGAELIITQTRRQAEDLAEQKQKEGAWLLHPSADARVIAGQGTTALEALQDGANPDAIFAACGGGGLLSGTWLAAEGKTKVFGVEPKMANDAAQSVRTGKIVAFTDSPMTVADGARTLHISDITFHYLKQLDGFFEIEEEEILYWTQWLHHLLKTIVEPTAALAMAGAKQWLAQQTEKKRVLVILSGGNIGAHAQKEIWQKNYLERIPSL